MKNIRTEAVNIVIEMDHDSFDGACRQARSRAVMIHEIDDSGHCSDRDTFPRSSSTIVVNFVGMEILGGMGGWSYIYKFETYMECNRED